MILSSLTGPMNGPAGSFADRPHGLDALFRVLAVGSVTPVPFLVQKLLAAVPVQHH